MSQVLLENELLLEGVGSGHWMVVIFDNDTNSEDEVVGILMAATGCTEQEAAIETWEAQAYGKTPVHFDSKEACETAAILISSIGVKTEVSPEWND